METPGYRDNGLITLLKTEKFLYANYDFLVLLLVNLLDLLDLLVGFFHVLVKHKRTAHKTS